MEFYLVPNQHAPRLGAPRPFRGAPTCGLDGFLVDVADAPSPARIPKQRTSARTLSPFADIADFFEKRDAEMEDEAEVQRATLRTLIDHRRHRQQLVLEQQRLEEEAERERARQIQHRRQMRVRELEEQARFAARAREQQRQRHLQLLQLQQQREREQRERAERAAALEHANRRQRRLEHERRRQEHLKAQNALWQALQHRLFDPTHEYEQERRAALETHLEEQARKEEQAQANNLKAARSNGEELFEGALQLGDAFMRAFFGAEAQRQEESKAESSASQATEAAAVPQKEHAVSAPDASSQPRKEADAQPGSETTSSTPHSAAEQTEQPVSTKPTTIEVEMQASEEPIKSERVLFDYPHAAPTTYDAANLSLKLEGDGLRIDGLWAAPAPAPTADALNSTSTRTPPAHTPASPKPTASRDLSPQGSRGRSPRRARVSDVDENDMEIVTDFPEEDAYAEQKQISPHSQSASKSESASESESSQHGSEEETGFVSVRAQDASPVHHPTSTSTKDPAPSSIWISLPSDADKSSIRADLHDQGLTIYIS